MKMTRVLLGVQTMMDARALPSSVRSMLSRWAMHRHALLRFFFNLYNIKIRFGSVCESCSHLSWFSYNATITQFRCSYIETWWKCLALVMLSRNDNSTHTLSLVFCLSLTYDQDHWKYHFLTLWKYCVYLLNFFLTPIDSEFIQNWANNVPFTQNYKYMYLII